MNFRRFVEANGTISPLFDATSGPVNWDYQELSQLVPVLSAEVHRGGIEKH
jgi:hypothetical protein